MDKQNEIIEIAGMVTIHKESGTYFIRLKETNERIKANDFLHYLEAAFAELNNGNLYFGMPDLEPGDKFTIKIEIQKKSEGIKTFNQIGIK